MRGKTRPISHLRYLDGSYERIRRDLGPMELSWEKTLNLSDFELLLK